MASNQQQQVSRQTKSLDEMISCLKTLNKKYNVIYADPPWKYKQKKCNGAAENHYATMSLRQMMRVPISHIADTNCCLLLWCTSRWFRVPSSWWSTGGSTTARFSSCGSKPKGPSRTSLFVDWGTGPGPALKYAFSGSKGNRFGFAKVGRSLRSSWNLVETIVANQRLPVVA